MIETRILGGLSKTGSTSLAAALRILGIRSTHCPTTVSHLLRREATTDISAFRREYVAAAERAGRVRFIFTTRPLADWLDSCQFHYTQALDQVPPARRAWYLEARREVFGAEYFDPDLWAAAYDRQLEWACSHFPPEDLLIFPLCEGAGWEPLCKFLELPVPTTPFPHRNARRNREARQDDD